MKYSAEQVYNAMTSVDIGAVKEVECVYVDGECPMECYGRVWDAYRRLCERLGGVDEDEDLECIINEFFEMQRYVGIKMYEYGIRFSGRK